MRLSKDFGWDWTNDGTWDTDCLSSSTINHIYTTDGNYIVNLQVRDADGLRDNDTATATIVTSSASGRRGRAISGVNLSEHPI